MAELTVIDRLYQASNNIQNAEDKSTTLQDFRFILENRTGNDKTKQLVAQLIPRFFHFFPDRSGSFDAQLDLCEDLEINTRGVAIRGLVTFATSDKDMVARATDVCGQLLYSEEAVELQTVKRTLAALCDISPQGALTSLCEHLTNPSYRDKTIPFLAAQIRRCAPSFPKEVQQQLADRLLQGLNVEMTDPQFMELVSAARCLPAVKEEGRLATLLKCLTARLSATTSNPDTPSVPDAHLVKLASSLLQIGKGSLDGSEVLQAVVSALGAPPTPDSTPSASSEALIVPAVDGPAQSAGASETDKPVDPVETASPFNRYIRTLQSAVDIARECRSGSDGCRAVLINILPALQMLLPDSNCLASLKASYPLPAPSQTEPSANPTQDKEPTDETNKQDDEAMGEKQDVSADGQSSSEPKSQEPAETRDEKAKDKQNESKQIPAELTATLSTLHVSECVLYILFHLFAEDKQLQNALPGNLSEEEAKKNETEAKDGASANKAGQPTDDRGNKDEGKDGSKDESKDDSNVVKNPNQPEDELVAQFPISPELQEELKAVVEGARIAMEAAQWIRPERNTRWGKSKADRKAQAKPRPPIAKLDWEMLANVIALCRGFLVKPMTTRALSRTPSWKPKPSNDSHSKGDSSKNTKGKATQSTQRKPVVVKRRDTGGAATNNTQTDGSDGKRAGGRTRNKRQRGRAYLADASGKPLTVVMDGPHTHVVVKNDQQIAADGKHQQQQQQGTADHARPKRRRDNRNRQNNQKQADDTTPRQRQRQRQRRQPQPQPQPHAQGSDDIGRREENPNDNDSNVQDLRDVRNFKDVEDVRDIQDVRDVRDVRDVPNNGRPHARPRGARQEPQTRREGRQTRGQPPRERARQTQYQSPGRPRERSRERSPDRPRERSRERPRQRSRDRPRDIPAERPRNERQWSRDRSPDRQYSRQHGNEQQRDYDNRPRSRSRERVNRPNSARHRGPVPSRLPVLTKARR